MEPQTQTTHAGGGFNPPEPTTKGGRDYGRFVESVRMAGDMARGVDAPDDVITAAANLIEQANALLSPHLADEWNSPSGRRLDLPNRGGVLNVPSDLNVTEDGRSVGGPVRFRRYHLGRNGAAHGGAIGLLFDSVLGYAAYRLSDSQFQRTAYLHINYRKIAPVERDLQASATLERIDGRKIFITGALMDGDTVLADAEALFVKLKPGQP